MPSKRDSDQMIETAERVGAARAKCIKAIGDHLKKKYGIKVVDREILTALVAFGQTLIREGEQAAFNRPTVPGVPPDPDKAPTPAPTTRRVKRP